MIKNAINRLAKGSFIYGIGGMLQRFMGILLLPFFTRVLTPEDYGVISLVSLVGVTMSGLLTLGTGNSLGLLYFRENDTLKRPVVIWTNLVLMILNGVFWYAVLYLLAPTLSSLMFQTNEYINLIRISFLGSILLVVFDPWLAYLRMEEKAKQYIGLTLTSSALNIIISVWLVLFLRIGLLGLVLAGVITNCIMLFVIWAFVGRKLTFGIDIRLFKPLVRIGFPSIFGLFAFLLIDYADRQMIERMLGLTDLGIYSIGYSFGMVMTILVGAFATAWPPFYMSYVNKRDEARKVFAKVLTYYTIGFGCFTLLFFFIAKPILILLVSSQFHEAWAVVGLVAAGYALKGSYLILLPGISFNEQLHKQSAIEWVAAITNVLLNLWLIPVYGIFGAAIATFCSYLILPVLAWLVGRKLLIVDYQWKRVLGTFIFIGTVSTVLFQISKNLTGGFIQVFSINSLFVLLSLFITYILLLTNKEKDFIWSKFR